MFFVFFKASLDNSLKFGDFFVKSNFWLKETLIFHKLVDFICAHVRYSLFGYNFISFLLLYFGLREIPFSSLSPSVGRSSKDFLSVVFIGDVLL